MNKPSDTRWGDKTPANVDRLPQILRIEGTRLPDGRYRRRDIIRLGYEPTGANG